MQTGFRGYDSRKRHRDMPASSVSESSPTNRRWNHVRYKQLDKVLVSCEIRVHRYKYSADGQGRKSAMEQWSFEIAVQLFINNCHAGVFGRGKFLLFHGLIRAAYLNVHRYGKTRSGISFLSRYVSRRKDKTRRASGRTKKRLIIGAPSYLYHHFAAPCQTFSTAERRTGKHQQVCYVYSGT